MLTLYSFPRTRGTRVSWTLEELQLDYQFEPINLAAGEGQAPEYLAFNPTGKVPALRDGELLLLESAAICQYLAERYGEGKLLPPTGSAASGVHAQWLSFIISELEQPLWSIGKHTFALPEAQRVPAMLPVASWEFAKAMAVADKLLPASTWLTGEQFTVADILLTHTLNWAVAFEQPISAALEAYRQRGNQRPALKQAVAKESAFLPAQN